MDIDGLRSSLAEHDQSHLLGFWDSLTDNQKAKLFADLSSIDLDETTAMFKAATAKPDPNEKSVDERMQTIEEDLCASIIGSSEDDVTSYRRRALEAVSRGQVGVLLLAGGQGTRLGVPSPKGMFDIGLPSGKTLYQIQVERILRLEELALEQTGRRGSITMYIMTSERTKLPTAEFFESHGHFGKEKQHVILFEQRMIPCFDLSGKIILETPSRVARAPDGNGGLYWALKHEHILEDIETRGVKYLHAYCVDNVLVKVADPVFMGYAISKGAESANKVVEKAFPSEAVGVVCRVDGRIQVVEYSEIGKETSELRNPDDGKLIFKAGNICNHFFTAEFLRRVCDECDNLIPYHVARKIIPYVDPLEKNTVTPNEPNGIKLEKFVFDVFQFSSNFLVWECLRDDEFSPLKNGDGPGKKDTPKTARESLFALHRRFIKRAGGIIAKNAVENGEIGGGDHDQEAVAAVCEISPLVSYAGENLEALVKGKTLKAPLVLEKS